jgi:hypothetical protein
MPIEATGAYHRTLGLSVPVTDLLDPALWRARYAYGLLLGPSADPAVVAGLSCKETRWETAQSAGGQAIQAAAIADAVDEMPPDAIRWHLRAAASEMEIKLGQPLGIVIAKSTPVDTGLVRGAHYDIEVPRRPFLRSDQMQWYKIDLPSGVLSVERVRAYWFNQLVWEVAAENILLEWPGVGSSHILPTSMSTLLISSPAISAADYGAFQLIQGWTANLPGVWAVDYTLGPRTKTGEPGQIEAVLADWVYAVAGQKILAIAGAAAARGLQSMSLSIDGLSRSVSITQGGVNGAVIQALKDAEQRIDWKALKMYKSGLRLRPYGG